MEMSAKCAGTVLSFGIFIKHSLSLFLVHNLHILSALIEHHFVVLLGRGTQ